MIDLNHTLWQSCEWSNLRMENDSTLTGYKLVKGWGPERHVYFTAVFSKKLKDFRIMQDKKPVIYNTSRFRSTNEAWGKNLMACLSFATEEGEEVIVKTSVSAVSTAGAQLNMQELDGMTFDGLKEKGIDLWEQELEKYRVTADRKTKATFYTSAYHAALQGGRCRRDIQLFPAKAPERTALSVPAVLHHVFHDGIYGDPADRPHVAGWSGIPAADYAGHRVSGR